MKWIAFSQWEKINLVNLGLMFVFSRRVMMDERFCTEAMIMACISNGINRKDKIARAVFAHIGHRYARVSAVLAAHTASDLKPGLWFRDDTEAYHLHLVDHSSSDAAFAAFAQEESK